jgi:hypothetical protein
MIKKFGYFFVFISKGHIATRIGEDRYLYNLNKRGEKIRIVYMPYTSDPELRLWGMDSCFSERIYKKVKTNVQERLKDYKGYPYTMRRLLNMSQTARCLTKVDKDGNKQR